jgi:hypothetical protein
MFERLLSRLRGHRRQAARRRNRRRAWPRDARTRGGAGPGWAGGEPAGGTGGPAGRAARSPGPAEPWGEPSGRHRRDVTAGDVPGPAGPGYDTPAGPPPISQPFGHVQARTMPSAPAGGARARVREHPDAPEPIGSPVRTQPPPQRHAAAGQPGGGTGEGGQPAGRRARGRQAHRTAARAAQSAQDQAARAEAAQAQAWYELAGGWQRPDGSAHCGSLDPVVHRQWDAGKAAPAAALLAVRRLAELPQKLKDMLATAVDAIYVGPGGVPELDDMGRLQGVPLPSGRATWDACAGAYGDRKIVVGTRPSPSPDVMCHEVGHAIDDSDAPPGRWQSDSAEFRMLYDQCLSHLVSDFHRQPGALGRREFFADAFSAIASRQRPALVDMLGGSTRVALNVMLYYNRRYGI